MRLGNQNGFTLIAVLAAMLMLALGTNQVVTVLAQQAQREREEQLLQVGQAYLKAIGEYYENTPGTVKRWPSELSDLLEDTRLIGLRRYLRKAYFDPITRSNKWGVVRAPDGGIQGVYSLSELRPIRTAGVGLPDEIGPTPARYSDWRFVYQPKSR